MLYPAEIGIIVLSFLGFLVWILTVFKPLSSSGPQSPQHCRDIDSTTWGWCGDKDKNQAMKGMACGPFPPQTCTQWFWGQSQCSKLNQSQSQCNLVCGLGKSCPPPSCSSCRC